LLKTLVKNIFLLIGKTFSTLFLPEIIKLIVKSIFYTGTCIVLISGLVKLTLSFTKFLEWSPNFLDNAIDDIVFWITLKIVWLLVPILMPIIAGLFDDKIVFAINKKYQYNDMGKSSTPFKINYIGLLKLLVFGLTVNMALIILIFINTIGPVYNLIPSFIIKNIFFEAIIMLAPILYIGLNSYVFGVEFFQIFSTSNRNELSKKNNTLKFHIKIICAGSSIFCLSLIPFINLIVPIIGIVLMTHLYHIFNIKSHFE